MGNSFEEWGEEEIQLDLEDESSLFRETGISSFQKKEALEKETENILDRMEDSYQRLEKVLKVFNRMLWIVNNMTQKKLSPLTKVASQMGKKGGKAGTGSSKKRGNSSYYRDMQRKSVASRMEKTNERKT